MSLKHVGADLLAVMPEEIVSRCAPCLHVGDAQQRLVVEHLLEMGNAPRGRRWNSDESRTRPGRTPRRCAWREGRLPPWKAPASRGPSATPAGGADRRRPSGTSEPSRIRRWRSRNLSDRARAASRACLPSKGALPAERPASSARAAETVCGGVDELVPPGFPQLRVCAGPARASPCGRRRFSRGM